MANATDQSVTQYHIRVDALLPNEREAAVSDSTKILKRR